MKSLALRDTSALQLGQRPNEDRVKRGVDINGKNDKRYGWTSR